MELEALSLLCTFENSSNCIIISFDSDSFPEQLKGLLRLVPSIAVLKEKLLLTINDTSSCQVCNWN